MPGEHGASVLHSHETGYARWHAVRAPPHALERTTLDATPSSRPGTATCASSTRSAKPARTLPHPLPSFEKWQQRLERIRERGVSRVAEVDGAVVGHLALHTEPNPRRRHAAGLGMMLDASRHGRGIGSRLLAAAIDLAENWLDVTRIELTVFVDNRAAIALYEKHGFRIEGESPDYALRDGAYASVYRMARLRPRP
ncbi:GNAT family N-acetyltransferase [Burkholderia multivorans]|uniref:GNAT family N-acetyltransferase n=1 Tax=Burkholderia multivorans TaxID=87883 RepID=UPI002159A42D|nr:GNAT family N-acetyltransferase [Burkholderia multivorans]MDN8091037.1 GNAT family N-acetyltransferase [Burkholderia multivorans]MDN8096864.1 GNAT family N-acetyltransferase [Burkholderia multivorans]MDN8106485.1 GNAT family N-acetyltransferase [Burkholderia multivorans]MDN8125297.1 GNAT family N-acetyltransferase [Burkholderia multivorans]MDN8130927.1 GNAT family N-acetyltransferase [Burkholderia multivorans]